LGFDEFAGHLASRMNDHSILGSVFLLLGGAILLSNVRAIQTNLKATKWRPVRAKVLQAFVRKNAVGRGGLSSLFQRTDRAYILQYQLDGRGYQWTSDLDCPIPPHLSAGAHVQLHVNPSNPEDAVFAPGVRSQHLLNLIPSLTLIGAGLFFLFGNS
jgi:hypothetical protein